MTPSKLKILKYLPLKNQQYPNLPQNKWKSIWKAGQCNNLVSKLSSLLCRPNKPTYSDPIQRTHSTIRTSTKALWQLCSETHIWKHGDPQIISTRGDSSGDVGGTLHRRKETSHQHKRGMAEPNPDHQTILVVIGFAWSQNKTINLPTMTIVFSAFIRLILIIYNFIFQVWKWIWVFENIYQ